MGNPLLDGLKEQHLLETVSIALPTLGRFYDEDVLKPGADPADMEVRQVGIMAELHAQDPFMLAAGKGVAALIMQICPGVNKPEKLAEVDVEAILIASRIVSRGPIMRFTHQCENPKTKSEKKDGKTVKVPVCRHENDIQVDLQEYIMKYEPLEFGDIFVVDIPEYEQRVFLRPMEYGEAMNLLKKILVTNNNFKKFDNEILGELINDSAKIEEYTLFVSQAALANIEGIINGIFYVEYKGNKVFDKNHIKGWLVSISRAYTRRIAEKQLKLAEFLRSKTSITYNCAECGFKNKTNVELDIQKLFFSEAEPSEEPKTPSSTSGTKEKLKRKPSRTLPKSVNPTREPSHITG